MIRKIAQLVTITNRMWEKVVSLQRILKTIVYDTQQKIGNCSNFALEIEGLVAMTNKKWGKRVSLPQNCL